MEAHIPIDLRPVAEEEAAHIRTRISTELEPGELKDLPEHDDKVLSAWLKMINAKLEVIIGLMDKEREEFRTLPYRKVVLSGAGILVFLNSEFPEGEVLEMRMMLPSIPPVAAYVYGRVVRCKEGETWIKYLPMSEEIRDRIVHFVFMKQRENLREKREGGRMGE